jgi:arginyl-tRNA synthetase
MGDFALPCFAFAKTLRKAPNAIAAEAVAGIKEYIPPVIKAEAAGGYVNFTCDALFAAQKTISDILGNQNVRADGGGKTIVIDYSSINIAKPFHIGHLSTTAIGAALYRVYKRLGYKTIGINHLGDYGTQFGKLIVAFKLWGNKDGLRTGGVKYLTELYVRYHNEADSNPALDNDARSEFLKIEQGDKEAVELFSLFKEITLADVKRLYARLGIEFDSYDGEAFFSDKMGPVIADLEAQKLLIKSEGADIVDLSEYGMTPCLIRKADGATLYATRDLAAIYYRKAQYDFYKCLYVVAYQQNLHFKQVFKVIELLGKDYHDSLVHVPFGMVSLEDGTMSTRKGKVVLLEDVLASATEKAYKIIDEKNPALAGKEATAQMVGDGAVVFFALANSRIKDIVFSYDKVLNFDGETGPYLQYTHARAHSVLEKAGTVGEPNFASLDNREAKDLVSLLERYSDVLHDVADKYEPSYLSRYLINVAQAFNKFYFEHRIAGDAARTALTRATATILKEGLELLGIKAVEKM